ncbi:MAG: replication initiator protein [Microviridae sp.]|nr:MAG: replication initiator protein [Microviridae sp.]
MRCFYMQKTKPAADGSYKIHPCGHCIACRKAQATEWGIRNCFESLLHEKTVFLDLTYDDEHLPASNCPYFSGSLVKEHIPTFMKDLRYYCGSGIRYFCGAEYGEKTYRPHYHLLVFGIDYHNEVFYDLFYSKSKDLYVGYCKAWPYGNVTIGNVTPQSCFYVSKYSLKQTKEDYDFLRSYKQQPPFRLMSRNPGIGFDYLEKIKYQLVQDGFIRFKGSKIRIPRYYFDKLFPPGSDDREAVQMEKQKALIKINDDFYKNYRGLGKTEYFINNRLGEQQEKNFLRR